MINEKLSKQKIAIAEIVKDLHQLTLDIKHDELAKTVSELRNRILDPFMFVVVGEVKAGKSSFVNALLDSGQEICKTAASPMTDTIQQIIYGAEENLQVINPYLKRISLPIEILKEIAIVDTPGTNTIVAHHQEITEEFIPASDLIVFVFEAKNPYRQSAWEFFDYINADWRKKIIFVLQQKDLMNDADLQTNLSGVREYAEKKGIANPNIFAVSAKMEQDGYKENSGFKSLRQYIAKNITSGQAPFLKLENNIHLSKTINEKISKGLDTRNQQFKADLSFRSDIRNTLTEQENKSSRQVDALVSNLLSGYDAITLKKERELNEGLAFGKLLRKSISAFWSKKQSPKEWLTKFSDDLGSELNKEMRHKLGEGVSDIADSIQQMGKMVDLKIKTSDTILKNDHEIFSDIAERRANVLKDLRETFDHFLNKSENFSGEEFFQNNESISPNLAAGGGIALVGAILTTVTNGMVFDITGGILTTVGLLFAGVSVGWQRSKIIKGYREEILKGRNQLEDEVSRKLKDYITNIKLKIDNNFSKFDDMLNKEESMINELKSKQVSISEQLENLTIESIN